MKTSTLALLVLLGCDHSAQKVQTQMVDKSVTKDEFLEEE